jgi:cell division protein FtsB
MVVRRSISIWQRRILIVLVSGGVLAYFGWHAFHGNYGIYARQALEARVAELQKELEEVTAERRAAERRVMLLRAESLDPDLLEERARETLSLAHPNDVVIVERAVVPPAAIPPRRAVPPRRP